MNKSIENQIMDLRTEVVNDIVNELRNSGRSGCEFSDMMITNKYDVGGCFPIMYLKMVRLVKNGELVADVEYDGSDVTTLSQTEITHNLMTDCLNDIYKEVRQIIGTRLKRLEELRTIVRNNGGEINFDGNFTFCGYDASDEMYECENTRLMGLSLNENGELLIDDIWDGDEYTNSERFFRDTELDRIIEYVRNQNKRKFQIRAQALVSRVIDVEAASEDEAFALAKAELERNPFNQDDVDGIDWSNWK